MSTILNEKLKEMIWHGDLSGVKAAVEMLKKLTGKIASIDWMGDARVSSYEVLDCYIER